MSIVQTPAQRPAASANATSFNKIPRTDRDRPETPGWSKPRKRREPGAPPDENEASFRILLALVALFPILLAEIAPAVGGRLIAGMLIGILYATLLALRPRSGTARRL